MIVTQLNVAIELKIDNDAELNKKQVGKGLFANDIPRYLRDYQDIQNFGLILM